MRQRYCNGTQERDAIPIFFPRTMITWVRKKMNCFPRGGGSVIRTWRSAAAVSAGSQLGGTWQRAGLEARPRSLRGKPFSQVQGPLRSHFQRQRSAVAKAVIGCKAGRQIAGCDVVARGTYSVVLQGRLCLASWKNSQPTRSHF